VLTFTFGIPVARLLAIDLLVEERDGVNLLLRLKRRFTSLETTGSSLFCRSSLIPVPIFSRIRLLGWKVPVQDAATSNAWFLRLVKKGAVVKDIVDACQSTSWQRSAFNFCRKGTREAKVQGVPSFVNHAYGEVFVNTGGFRERHTDPSMSQSDGILEASTS